MLELQSVCVEFSTEGGPIRPVDQVFLTINQGERHVIIGETGSGKSVLLMSILGLSGGNVTAYFMERKRVSGPITKSVQSDSRKGDCVYSTGQFQRI